MAGDILKLVGASIRDTRKRLELSQEQLAEKSGFHTNYVSAVERGKKNITLLNLEKMAESLEVEVYELFNYTGIELGENSKQRDLQEIVELLLRLPNDDIKKAKRILFEIYEK